MANEATNNTQHRPHPVHRSIRIQGSVGWLFPLQHSLPCVEVKHKARRPPQCSRPTRTLRLLFAARHDARAAADEDTAVIAD